MGITSEQENRGITVQQGGVKVRNLPSIDKNLIHVAVVCLLQSWRCFHSFRYHRSLFNPPPPSPPRFQCQCCHVVQTKPGEPQTPRDNIEEGKKG